MSLPTYFKLRRSTLEWYDDVPLHWKTWRLGRAADLIGSGTTPASDNDAFFVGGTVPWVNTGDLEDAPLFDASKRVTPSALEAYSSLKIYPIGSVIIAMYGATIGKLAILELEAAVNQACCVFVCGERLRAPYLFYWFRAFRDRIIALGTGGGQPNISQEVLRSLRLELPPPAEQLAISAFLAAETAKIDALVNEQQRLVELLKEKRHALVSQAVTKGLNPDLPMKPSGIEWLGDIPAHWEVVPLKWYWSVTDCKHITAQFVDEGIPLASIREVQGRFVNLSEAKQTTESYYEMLIEGDRRPLSGDLIFSRNATVGEVAQVCDHHPHFAMGQDVCLLHRMDEQASPDFMQLMIRSPVVTQQLEILMVGSTFKRVNVEEIRNLRVLWPPVHEQKLIALHLLKELDELDELEEHCSCAIKLLNERRATLISAAVTGKIDVSAQVRKLETV